MKSLSCYDRLRLENQLCFPLYASSRAVVNRYKPLLDPLGLTYTQYITMMALLESGTLTVKELGGKLHLDSGTLTPLLKKLEAQGIVRRERSRTDERSVIVHLTERGVALREEAVMVPEKMAECIPISGKDAKELMRILSLLLRETDKDPD